MERIKLDQDIKPLSDFRANITSYIENLRKTKRPLVITQHGKSTAVMLDVSEYETLLDNLEVLKDIRLAESQIDNGEGISHSNAKQTILKMFNK